MQVLEARNTKLQGALLTINTSLKSLGANKEYLVLAQAKLRAGGQTKEDAVALHELNEALDSMDSAINYLEEAAGRLG